MWYIVNVYQGLSGWKCTIANNDLQQRKVIDNNSDYRELKKKLSLYGVNLPTQKELILIDKGSYNSKFYTTEEYCDYFSHRMY